MNTGTRGPNSRVALALLGAVLLLGACTSTEEEGEEAVSTTEVQVATSSTSTSTSAAETSTTMTDPAAAVEVAIAEAFDRQFAVWRSCSADYDACDPAAELPTVYSGTALENLTNSVIERRGNGRKNTPLDPDPDFQRIDEIEFTNDTLSAAEVAYCAVDSRLVSVYENGADVVFDDSVVHEQGLAFYELEADNVWRLDRFDVIESSAEVPLCDGS